MIEKEAVLTITVVSEAEAVEGGSRLSEGRTFPQWRDRAQMACRNPGC